MAVNWASVDVAVPRRPGFSMAGFSHHGPTSVDIAMVAHPSVTLLFDLSGLACETGGRRRQGSVAVGLLPGDLRVAGGQGACLQVRLPPVALLGMSADLSGTAAPLDEVWGREVGQVEDRLRAAASWDDRFAIVARFLARRLDARRRVDPELGFLWRRILASRGRLRVEELAGEVGWSRKRLWSRCRAQLGITPKRAARLVRFDHAAHLLAAGQDAAGVAAAGGYADQSHLHRETRALTGLTPAAVAAAPWLAIDDVAWPVAAGQASGSGVHRRISSFS
ncbi:MAG: helix-turn-helix domain-containing protein [Actinoplanes sp.]